MVKSVFIDYIGTTVDERRPEMGEIVRRICKNSWVSSLQGKDARIRHCAGQPDCP